MADYCSATDVQNRHTANGYKFVADRDGDGTVSAPEQASYVATAISWAGSTIDGMISGRYELATARASGNEWLNHRCVDLAAYRSATHGGRKAPKSYRDDYEAAMDMLKSVRDDGTPVPGLEVPVAPGSAGGSPAVPQFMNVNYGGRRWPY